MRRGVYVRSTAVAAIFLFGFAAGLPALAAANKPVKVDVKCPKQGDGKFSISVDPFEVVVDPGQGVEWKLYTDDSKNETIAVSAKDPEAWLYADTTVEGNKEVVMTEMIDPTPERVYEYQITVYCGDREPVVLDPRIRVGGG